MLKKLIASLFVLGVFSGCATDGIYNSGKTIYIKGKAVVVENYDSLPIEIQEKLKKVDSYATKYDNTREEIKSKVGNEDAE